MKYTKKIDVFEKVLLAEATHFFTHIAVATTEAHYPPSNCAYIYHLVSLNIKELMNANRYNFLCMVELI